MNGKVCVVTGATSGIGKAAATALARMGGQVVLVGRDRGRAEAAAAEIGATGTVPPKVEIADLASMEQVRALAGRLASLERIDVLINNAGLVLGAHRVTKAGFEHAFAVTHLAPLLLTNPLPALTSMTPAWSTDGIAGVRMPTANWRTSCSPASWPAGSPAPG
jgi:NAD(P)-dependent dehydrogenase (short-subunit alcohol dehydrogenase family)